MSKHVKFISFDKLNVGKHVKSTKKKFTWKFELNNQEHQVDMYCSRVTGRRKVLLNGDIRYESNALGGIGITYPFRFERSIIMVVQTGDCDFDLRIDNFSLELLAKKQRSEQTPKNPFEQNVVEAKTRNSDIYNRPATTRHSEHRPTQNSWTRTTVIGAEHAIEDPWKTPPKADNWESQAKPYIQPLIRSDPTQVFKKSPTIDRQISSPTLPNPRVKLQPVRGEHSISNFVDLLDLGEEDRSNPPQQHHIKNTGISHSASLVINSKPGNLAKPATPHKKNNPFMFDDSDPFENPAPSNGRASMFVTSDPFSTVPIPRNQQGNTQAYATADPFAKTQQSNVSTYEASNSQSSMYSTADPFSYTPQGNIPSQNLSGVASNQMYYSAPSPSYNGSFPYPDMNPAQGNMMMVPNPMAQMLAMNQFMSNTMMGQMLNNPYYSQQPK